MARARCCFDIRRVMRAVVRTYQFTMGQAYYKCTLRFSSTSNVTDTHLAPGASRRAPNLRRADSTITIMATQKQQETIYQEGRIALAIQDIS